MKDQNSRTETGEVIALVGAGRAGQALAQLFAERGIPVNAVVDIDFQKAEACQRLCSSTIASTQLDDLTQNTAIVLIAVPDDAIADVGDQLAAGNIVTRNIIAVHTSGLLSSRVLKRVSESDGLVASFHPCTSFVEGAPATLDGVCITLEGDDEAVQRLTVLARKLGAIPKRISADAKPLYHAACALASNHFVALLRVAGQMMAHLGDPDGMKTLLPLIRTTLGHVEESGVKAALTGPVSRGDCGTVQQHIQALAQYDPAILDIYRTTGTILVRMAEQQGLPAETIQRLDTIFRQIGEI